MAFLSLLVSHFHCINYLADSVFSNMFAGMCHKLLKKCPTSAFSILLERQSKTFMGKHSRMFELSNFMHKSTLFPSKKLTGAQDS